ncbi:MAG TPA: lipase maturation factor family protein [Bryobacteraceae bacterium]|nr:lipase maturation factor family protein [Bryobacteraceae bacterium]
MSADAPRAVLVFDGDCAFCRMWAGYWEALTGDRVEYVPYQTAARRFRDVPESEFRGSVQLFERGQRYSAAEAVARLIASRPDGAWALWVYQHLPGAAPLAEFLYRFIAAHRDAGYRITRALWGAAPRPATYKIASSWFARAIGLIYLIAFVSFGRQVRGLIGAQGIQPVTEYFTEIVRQFGPAGFWQSPTIFWWVHSDYGLESIVWGGAVVAGVAAIGRPHTSGQKAALVLLFIYYLSVVNAGQIFMGYQWDYLLLEAGFLAIFLKPVFTRVWLFRWLLFRLMFESGSVKLLSHDLSWRHLTALAVHYQTQPLPTPIAWYMMQAPLWFHKASTLCVFVVELALPFLMFGPRRLKQIAAAGTIGLQMLILLTGNYTFFNLLTIALCLFLLDDALLTRKPNPAITARPLHVNRYVSAALVTLVMVVSLAGLAGMFGLRVPGSVSAVIAPAAPFGIVNQYGLFASMTTSRPEISIEGSNDGMDWQAYTFKDKPGPLNRAPTWVAPMQPRLDWQMWFAALGNYRENPWLLRFMMRLLQGSAPVLDLLDQNPFGGKPPRYIRAVVYDYQFTNFAERRQTGNWWKRELKGTYFPPISLRSNADGGRGNESP